MKITVWTWKDERWTADKETLDAINKMIKKEKPLKVKWVSQSSIPAAIGDKIFLAIGWIAMFPFILSELIIQGFKRIKRSIKK